jgi:hypothetical protein
MKKFRKLLLVILLGPLLPIFGVPDDGSNEGDNEGNNEDPTIEEPKEETNKIPEKTFSQAELDKILEKRLGRERKAWQKKADEDKAKADLTENEKLKLEKEEAEKKVLQTIQEANKRLIRADIISKAAKLNVIDTDAVIAMISMDEIDVDDKGDISGVDDALKSLIEKKPYLIKGKNLDNEQKAGDDQQQNQSKKTKISFNDMLRKATGRM